MRKKLKTPPCLFLGDAVDVMKNMEENSIDLTITSPPYDNLRSYGGCIDQWGEQKWREVIGGLFRVTKRGGVVVWIAADATINKSETCSSFKQAIWAKECGFNLHDTMIWCKDNPVPTQSTRYQNAFEYMFVFSKGAPVTFNKLMEPTKRSGERQKKHRAKRGEGHLYNNEGFYVTKNEKLRGNWWVVSCGSAVSGHGATFPEKLVRDHVLSWSNEGEVVFDPFMGSGTTGKVAGALGRGFIGVEINEGFFEMARKRLGVS